MSKALINTFPGQLNTGARYFCLGADKDISEKRNIFVNRSLPENFQRESSIPELNLFKQNRNFDFLSGVFVFFCMK